MTTEATDFATRPRRRGTLKIKRLLATQLKLFRLDLVGQDHPALVRVGAWLIFGPFLLVGYAFALAAAVRYLAIRLGWGVGLLLVGSIHLIVGAWGMRRSRAIAFAQSYDVVVPECEPARSVQLGFDDAITLPSLYRPLQHHGQAPRRPV
jgi:hypothetical protein